MPSSRRSFRSRGSAGNRKPLKRQRTGGEWASMSLSRDDTSGEVPSPALKPRRGFLSWGRLGLSGKLLLLTIPLVMIAEVLIYVPSIANFYQNRLNDRLAAANTAGMGLDAAPSGMVPESPARQNLGS